MSFYRLNIRSVRLPARAITRVLASCLLTRIFPYPNVHRKKAYLSKTYVRNSGWAKIPAVLNSSKAVSLYMPITEVKWDKYYIQEAHYRLTQITQRSVLTCLASNTNTDFHKSPHSMRRYNYRELLIRLLSRSALCQTAARSILCLTTTTLLVVLYVGDQPEFLCTTYGAGKRS